MSKHEYQLIMALLASGLLAGCGSDEGASMGSHLNLQYDETLQQAVHKTCGTNSNLRGVDVSKWQETIDWNKVKADPNYDIQFAIARVSDGLKYPDSQFDNNWQGIKDAGLVRGVYQFFRPSQDAVKQADYLLNKIGSKLEPNDLPPIIDVEEDEDLDAATVADGVRKWINRVESVLGVKPIIYTGGYFWDSHVKINDFADYPLWHAAYPNTFNQSTSCPSISDKWTKWTMWQYSSTAHIQGIRKGTGDVDISVINGGLDELLALTYGGTRRCEAIPADGVIIDETDPCFIGGGKDAMLRRVTDAGYNNTLRWSNTWISDHVGNYGQWNFNFEVGGKYRLDTYLTKEYGELTAVPYQITHNGVKDIVNVDQTGYDGWKTVGTFYFAKGAGQNLYIDDLAASTELAKKKFVLDAVRLVPVELDKVEVDLTKVCVNIPADGRVVDETEKCFVGGGGDKWLRQVDGNGYNEHLIWSNTETNALKDPTTTGTFNLTFDEAGSYELSAYIPADKASITAASTHKICEAVQYIVVDGTYKETVVELNQSSVNGWYSLGSFDFAKGANQSVTVADSVSSAAQTSKTFIIDAIKLDRIQEDPVEDITPEEDITFENNNDDSEESISRAEFITHDDSVNTDDDGKDDDEPLHEDRQTGKDDNQEGFIVSEADNPQNDGTAKRGCNSQAGDLSLAASLMMAAALWLVRRKDRIF